MSLSEKRKLYACADEYVKLEDIPSWHDCLKNERLKRRYPKGKAYLCNHMRFIVDKHAIIAMDFVMCILYCLLLKFKLYDTVLFTLICLHN